MQTFVPEAPIICICLCQAAYPHPTGRQAWICLQININYGFWNGGRGGVSGDMCSSSSKQSFNNCFTCFLASCPTLNLFLETWVLGFLLSRSLWFEYLRKRQRTRKRELVLAMDRQKQLSFLNLPMIFSCEPSCQQSIYMLIVEAVGVLEVCENQFCEEIFVSQKSDRNQKETVPTKTLLCYFLCAFWRFSCIRCVSKLFWVGNTQQMSLLSSIKTGGTYLNRCLDLWTSRLSW